MNSITASWVWVSWPLPRSVPTTQHPFPQWENNIHRSLLPCKHFGAKRQNQALRWLTMNRQLFYMSCRQGRLPYLHCEALCGYWPLKKKPVPHLIFNLRLYNASTSYTIWLRRRLANIRTGCVVKLTSRTQNGYRFKARRCDSSPFYGTKSRLRYY